MSDKIDEAAIMWNKTKDPKYKDLWYKLIKEFVDGSYNLKRWNVSVSSCNKTDDGTYIVIGKRRPVRPLRHTKTKTDNVRRLPNQRTHDE
jgi:hypothetical protein